MMMATYLFDSFRLYAMRRKYDNQQIVGAAVALAIIGYLSTGFFNDSIVSVAPIFWVLLGVGLATNAREKL